jgi:hypothetical protein
MAPGRRLIIVADTSPLLHLARIGELDLVVGVVGEVIAPRAVWDELAASHEGSDSLPALRSGRGVGALTQRAPGVRNVACRAGPLHQEAGAGGASPHRSEQNHGGAPIRGPRVVTSCHPWDMRTAKQLLRSARRDLPAALGLVLLAGCGLHDSDHAVLEAPPPGDASAILSEQDAYVLQPTGDGWESTLRFSYRNESDATISLLNCRGGFALQLEKWQDDSWVPAWSPVVLGCLSAPIEIPPGETHEFDVGVFGGYPDGNVHPRFEVDQLDGYYRLVVTSAFWNYDAASPGWGDEVPLRYRVSNAFVLTTR